MVSLIGLVVLLAAFAAYVAGGAPRVDVVLVIAGALVVTIGGVYAAAPAAFESHSERVRVLGMLAVGLSIVLAYRVVFAVLEVGAEPNAHYSAIEWILAALVLQGGLLAAAGASLDPSEQPRVRETMGLFAIAGLGLAVGAEAARIIDLGFTAGRWGLVPVAAAFGFYPILSIPFHLTVSAVLGWGWSQRRNRMLLVGTLAGATLLTAEFNRAATRDPFSAFSALFVAVAAWGLLYATSSGGGDVRALTDR